MLTRDQLTDEEWCTVRNTPHHVAIAISAAGGSIFDEMLERAAAMAVNEAAPVIPGEPAMTKTEPNVPLWPSGGRWGRWERTLSGVTR